MMVTVNCLILDEQPLIVGGKRCYEKIVYKGVTQPEFNNAQLFATKYFSRKTLV